MIYTCCQDKKSLVERLSALRIPRAAGVYVVGGAIRDGMVGRRVKDIDLAVGGDAKSFAEEMARANHSRSILLGGEKGAIHRIPLAAGWVDISPIYGADIGEDLLRRDLTLNAMAMSLDTGVVIDPFGGRSDIDRRLVRMVCPDAFRNDPLRILRSFRFAAELDFSIDRATLREMKHNVPRLPEVAAERVRDELMGFLKCAGSRFWMNTMMETGVLAFVLPELGPLAGCAQNQHHAHDVLTHTFSAFSFLEKWTQNPPETFKPHQGRIPALMSETGAALLKLAALLHDIGKPSCRSTDASGLVHFHHHETIGARMARKRLELLRFSEKHTSYVHDIIGHHLRPLFLFRERGTARNPQRSATRFFMRCGARVPDIVLHSLADASGKGDAGPDTVFERFLADLLERYSLAFEPARNTAPLVTGHDLIKTLRLAPGPIYRQLLGEVRELQLSGEITTKEDALAWVLKRLTPPRGGHPDKTKEAFPTGKASIEEPL